MTSAILSSFCREQVDSGFLSWLSWTILDLCRTKSRRGSTKEIWRMKIILVTWTLLLQLMFCVLQYWTARTMPSKIVDVVCLGCECLSVQVSRGADQGTKLSKYLVTDNTDWHEEIISDLDTISHHPDLEHTSTHKTRLMLWRQVPAKLNFNSSESYFQQNTEDNCGHRNELQLVVGCLCHCII